MEKHVLYSDRLELRSLGKAHASKLLAYFQRNAAYLQPWEPLRAETFYTLEQQEANIARGTADVATGLGARFVAFAKGDAATIVGSINLSNIRGGVNHSAIVGYSVDERCAGRGYATEMLGTIVRFAFEDLMLHRLDASYQPENRASGRVLYKLGFVVEGYARDYLFLNGAWRDGVLVSRTNDAWKSPTP